MKNPVRFILNVALLYLNVCVCITSSAQTSLTGSVTNEQGDPVAFANVLLLQPADSSLVMGTVSEQDGTFALSDVSHGNYYLKTSMVGYQDLKPILIKLDVSDQQIDLGILPMTESIELLEEVEIVARKPLFEQKVDRLIVNVQNSVTAAGNTALDILQRSPGVMVNRPSNSLSIGGKSGVMILINGKRSRLPEDALFQLLAGTNTANIERIEILTAPPAKYDADGNAGAINIVLRQSPDEGWNGSVSGTGGYGRGPKVGSSLLLNWRKNKINLYADYSFLHDQAQEDWIYSSRFDLPDRLWESETFSDREPIINSHNGRIGVDIGLNEKTAVGLSLSGNSRYWDMDAVNDIQITTNQEAESHTTMENHEVNHWTQMSGNFNLTHTFQPDHTIELNADHIVYNNFNPEAYLLRQIDHHAQKIGEEAFRLQKKTPILIWVAGLDYTVPLSVNIALESGIRGSFSQFQNDVRLENRRGDEWLLDPDFSSLHMLTEDIGAGYINLSLSIGENVTLDAGLRYEHTLSNLRSQDQKDIVDRNYGGWFPSAFLSYSLADDHSLQFSFNRRINRPDFTQLAPYIVFVNPFTVVRGNPALQPSFIHSTRAGYHWRNYLLSLEYSYEKDAIMEYQPSADPETQKITISPQNMDYNQTLNLTLSAPFYVGNWWEMQNSLSGVWQEVQAGHAQKPFTVQKSYLMINSVHTFSLPAQFTFEIGGWWQTKSLFGISELHAWGAINAGIQKSFGEHKSGGTLSLNISDIFNTNIWDLSTDYPELYLQSRDYWDPVTRVVRLTYTLNIGNQQLKGQRNKRNNAKDIEQRVSY